jgi:uncharacterized protein involved in exopolysaccharide biosynthesis
MLDIHGTQQPVQHEDQDGNLDLSSLLSYVVEVLKRHFFLFILPFLVIILIGAAVIKFIPKMYQAEGEILVESQKMAPDLFRPSITELFDERFALFRQLIMTPDNLLAVINKFNLFPGQRASLSQYQLLDLMRSRIQIEPATLEMRPNNQTSTFAFTVKFDYEDPDVAVKVTNEFLTEILSADASRRTSTASETTKLVEQQVKQARDQHDAVVAQIEKLKRRPPDQAQIVSDDVKAQAKVLADLQADLIQKSSVYSEEHPVIKDLKRKIAALKRTVESAPQAVLTGDKSQDVAVQMLVQQETDLEKRLQDAENKLTIARLGETMERNQQTDHLRIISYPELPQKPIKPNKLRLFTIVLGLAGAIGAGCVFAAEMLNGSIRRSRDLERVIDKHLIVNIPYILAPGEASRKRRNFVLLFTISVVPLLAAVAGILIIHLPVDSVGFKQFSIHSLTFAAH